MLETNKGRGSTSGARRVGPHRLRLIFLAIKHATSEIMTKGDGSLLNRGAIKGKWRGLTIWLRGN